MKRLHAVLYPDEALLVDRYFQLESIKRPLNSKEFECWELARRVICIHACGNINVLKTKVFVP